MKRMNLQMFADAVPGKKLVYLFRIKENQATATGTLLSFVTDNSRSVSVDSDSTATKDGNIRTPGTPEVEITSTSILKKGDTMIAALEQAMLNNKVVQCWEANLEEAGTGNNKFKGTYYEGYITELEKNSAAEDLVEISITYGANGSGATGDVTVTTEQQEAAAYTFVDTTTQQA